MLKMLPAQTIQGFLFLADVHFSFTHEEHLSGTNWQKLTAIAGCFTYGETGRKRDVVTTVITLSDVPLCSYLAGEHHFVNIKTVGMLHRVGIRISKHGSITPVDEIVCFVSSRMLTAKKAAQLLRNHWCIENLLHWIKDFVYLEDRLTLRNGNSPEIMSFMRSMAISLANLVAFKSLSTAMQKILVIPKGCITNI